MKVVIPGSEQWDRRSSDGARSYRIFVAVPEVEPPASGFPVIYVLDANAIFGTVVEAMRIQSRRPEKTGVTHAVIVGIGYPTDAPFSTQRHYDFTMPRTEALPFTFPGMENLPHGGASTFLEFIEQELKPEVEGKYRIDRDRQSIVGHSLGGLFVLQVLLTRPSVFQRYIAGSPSIHWNKKFLYDELSLAAGRMERTMKSIGVFIGVGELEQAHRMVDNAREFASNLAAAVPSRLEVKYKMFEEEGHASVLPPLMSHALRLSSRTL
jgi:hypothetical protein